AMAVLVGLQVQPASAQNLFDLLFKNNRQNRVVREVPPEPVPVRPVAPPRVSGPSYYTYKTDALVKVDFAAIRPERADDAAMLPAADIDTASVGATERPGVDGVQVAQVVQREVASDAVPEAADGADLANALVEEQPVAAPADDAAAAEPAVAD